MHKNAKFANEILKSFKVKAIALEERHPTSGREQDNKDTLSTIGSRETYGTSSNINYKRPHARAKQAANKPTRAPVNQ